MSKIICDVCGTRYPDSSEQCPICGCVHKNATNEAEPNVQAEEFEIPARPVVRGGRFSKANVRKRNKNKPVYEEPVARPRPAAKKEKEVEEEEYDLEEEFEEETGKKGGAVLNVLLVLVIIALLAVSAYIFVEHFMPNFLGEEPTVPPTGAYVEPTNPPTEEPTDPPVIPCEQLVLDITDITLRAAGEVYLLNVQALPEGTTDTFMYISSNEDVATVNEEGRVTAVGEGSVVISVFCGDQQLVCNVTCDFSSEAATPDDAEGEGDGEGATETPTEAGVTMTVTSKTLNIRSGAGTKNDKVGAYKKGDKVTIYEQQKVGTQYWGRTDDGWVCMDYVK